MPRFDENCKSAVVDIARTTTGTPTAKLLAVLIAAGVTDNRELAQITGLSVRSIQHARATHCASDATHCAQPIAQRNPLREETQPIAPDAQPIALARDLQRAQANMEYPSGILIPREVNSPLVPQAVETAPVASPSAQPTQRVRGTRLNSDWTLPVEWRQWAEINTQLGPDGITLEADKFRDHWVAKAGAGSTKLDWMATWRNWCRTAGSRRPMNWGRNAYDERKAADKPMTLREALNRRIAEQERAAA